ncbi:S1 family peptidase, partial [Rhodococcus sp. NPDC055112]
FSGRDGVAGSSTTAQVTVAPADSDPVASTITLDPIKGATAGGKAIKLKAKVSPAAAGDTVTFEVTENHANGDLRNFSNEVPVGADGTATMEWSPANAGKATIDATFSGRDGVTGSTTTAQVTIAPAATTTPKPTTPKPTTPKPTTPKPTPAPDTIMGGTRYTMGDTGDHECSFGFNGTDGDGDVVNITAGHCDRHRENAGNVNATEVREGTTPFYLLGAFDKTVVDGGDYAVIEFRSDAAHRFQNNFVSTHGGDPLAITGTADPVVGAPVCKSGNTSGYTCGKITAINQYVNSGPRGATVPNAFAAKLCTIPGDSGGAMVTGTKALGIVSAGDPGNCDKPMTTWGQPINSVLAANPGLKIRTN